jgi:hypothetical protein
MNGRLFPRQDPRADRSIPPEKREAPGRASTSRWVRADEISLGLGSQDMLVASTSVHNAIDPDERDFVRSCVIFSAGTVNLSYPVVNSVIVCDGDVIAKDAQGCLIIAGGNVRVTRHAQACHITASGSVKLEDQDRSTKVKQKEVKPLGFIKWFDPASVGVVVEKTESGVRVKEVVEGKLFAKAGLRVGDIVTLLSGAKTDSPDVFRRLLRSKIALNTEMSFQVRRGEKTLEIVVESRN